MPALRKKFFPSNVSISRVCTSCDICDCCLHRVRKLAVLQIFTNSLLYITDTVDFGRTYISWVKLSFCLSVPWCRKQSKHVGRQLVPYLISSLVISGLSAWYSMSIDTQFICVPLDDFICCYWCYESRCKSVITDLFSVVAWGSATDCPTYKSTVIFVLMF